MSNLEDLYNETGIKEKPSGFKIKSGLIKFSIYTFVLGGIIYWAFSNNIFGSNTSQPYYFIVIVVIFLYAVMKKITSFWGIIKQNKKFLKP